MDDHLKILYLEDDADDAEIVRLTLQGTRLDCELTVVNNRAAYLGALRTGRFDLILCDNHVEGLDAWSALTTLREHGLGIPFICVSGYLEEREEERLKRAGGSDVVFKHRLEELEPAILKAMDTREPASAPLPDETPRTRPYHEALERLVQVVHELSLARDLETVMAIVRQAARELTGADGGTFILREGDLSYYADEDAISPLFKGKRFPLTDCVGGWAMLERRPAVIEDVFADPRTPPEAYRPTFVKSLAVVPIRRGNPIGAVGAYWSRQLQPSPEAVKVLQALADTTSVAMENVQLYAELEQRVRDRTAQLEAANQELETFSYAVSHDLKAPLRKIIAFTQVLAERYDGLPAAERQDYFNRVQRAAGRMWRLIDDLLSLSRMTRAPLRREWIDLGAMAREVMAELAVVTPERRVELAIPPKVPAHGDAGLMRVVLENLLGNAWKFTAKRPLPRIELGMTETSDGKIVYSVRDNGAGFDLTDPARLFTPFQRAHPEAEFPGTGIGLATVQRIIHKHSGRIWAEGVPDAGAAFHFTLG